MADELSLAEEMRRRQERVRQQQTRPADQAVEGTSAWREQAQIANAADAGEVQLTAYGYYRGVRERATYVEFQLRKGSWPAPGYAWLPCPIWLPDGIPPARGQAIVLAYVNGLRITLYGRNLRPLWERLLKQQVFRVSEMGEEADRYLPEEDTVLYHVAVEEPAG